jgi:hypothetical protein
MTLSPFTSIQGNWVDVCFSSIDLLSMVSHHFLAILILSKTPAMHVNFSSIGQSRPMKQMVLPSTFQKNDENYFS